MITALKMRLACLAVIVLALLQPAATWATPSLVIEAGTGRILHGEDIFVRWHPASLTKLMTAYVAFREVEAGRLTLQSPVRISVNAARNPPSRMAYPVGTILTLDNALKMMIVKSANDISVAIAESVSGTEEAFVERMNAEARRLGMTDTRFANPNGLHDDGQYSSARDLALLTRAILREFPEREGYFSIEAISTGERVYRAYNLLLGRFDGANGMKTGYVCESGFNLAATATRGDITLIAIVLGEISSNTRAEKAATLLQKGFDSYSPAADLPLIQVLQKPAGVSDTPVNMRATVCGKEANAIRAAEKREVFGTPLLKPLERAPVAVAVQTGGSVGSSRSATMLLGRVVQDIPVPAERPERVSLPDEDDLVKYGLAPGEFPIPESRPET